MKWIGLLAVSTAVYASTAAAQAHIRCQPTIGGVCGDSSRPRDYNCCDYGYCQPWNSGYYQCLNKPDRCPTQETDIDYAGNDIKTIYGLKPDKCCDACTETSGCTAYTFVNQNPDGKTACYLKKATTGRVEKKGAVSGVVATFPGPEDCPVLERGFDYAGNDIKLVKGVDLSGCCDECRATANCAGYTYIEQGNPDGNTHCYLKSSAAGKIAKVGAISAKVRELATPPPLTRPPTTTPSPPPAKCPTQENNVDYYGNDLKTLNGVTQTACCDACSTTAKCVAYTYVGKDSACYLKSSIAGKVAKAGAVSGQLPVTEPPLPPPSKCPTQENNVDYYGNDIKTLNGVTQTVCCDECSKLAGCVAYTYFEKNCYLKSSTKGKVAKTGAVSATVVVPVTPPPLPITPKPPLNCPTQLMSIDFYGNDIKTLRGVTQTQCCDECGKTDRCVAYTFIEKNPDGKTACYLKNATKLKIARDGAISGTLQDTGTEPPFTLPPQHPPNCPVQFIDTDFYGNDIKTIYSVTSGECCDKCGDTPACVAYTFIAENPDGRTACYLKASPSNQVKRKGARSGTLTDVKPPPNCPNPERNIAYAGFDIREAKGLTYAQCCDECGSTPGCRATTFIEPNTDGRSSCYLKSDAVKKDTMYGAISSVYKCPKSMFSGCGSAATGAFCCPLEGYCQPWNTNYYQCVPSPDTAKCPKIVSGVDFYGGDIDVKYGLQPGACCDACFNNKDCVVYTFVNENPDGKTACYLKNKLVEQRAKAGAVSGYKMGSLV